MPQITYRHEVPFGHRLMNHKGKCRFPHGHNYLFEATVYINVLNGQGMVMDFSVLKGEVRRFFEAFDHAFVLWEGDPYVEVLDVLPTVKLVILDQHPTAEVLAELLRNYLVSTLPAADHVHVTCHEQRDCWALSYTRTVNPEIVRTQER